MFAANVSSIAFEIASSVSWINFASFAGSNFLTSTSPAFSCTFAIPTLTLFVTWVVSFESIDLPYELP